MLNFRMRTLKKLIKIIINSVFINTIVIICKVLIYLQLREIISKYSGLVNREIKENEISLYVLHERVDFKIFYFYCKDSFNIIRS